MSVMDHVLFRMIQPKDIPTCAEIEKDSYPEDEMASLTTFQYRQRHASKYFRCAVLKTKSGCSDIALESTMYSKDSDASNGNIAISHNKNVTMNKHDDSNDAIVGYICSTRCREFTKEAMYSQHVEDGSILAIHSVAVRLEYRRQGLASAMMNDYIRTIQSNLNSDPSLQNHAIDKIVLLSKANLLSFYVNCGFQVLRPSTIVHGKEQWFELEMDLRTTPQHPNNELLIPCYIIDSFADPKSPGSGNPAAVVVFDKQTWIRKFMIDTNENVGSDSTETTMVLTETAKIWMQSVASEFNLSETAFIWPFHVFNGNSTQRKQVLHDVINLAHPLEYNIRFFTPTAEESLCGHATLASASVLYQNLVLWPEHFSYKCHRSCKILFHTGVQDVDLETKLSSCDENQRRFTNITMNFPCHPPQDLKDESDRVAVQQLLFNALNVNASSILYIGTCPDLGDLFVELTYDSFMQIPYTGIQFKFFLDWDMTSRGVIISCEERRKDNEEVSGCNEIDQRPSNVGKEEESVDFYSRFFGPKSGIDEDPVTGSAHCALAPYYLKRSTKMNSNALIGYQRSSRGGVVYCNVSDDRKTVELNGTAVNAVTGTLWR